jgi:diguanylate cyclase (GGDEF)-like protein
MLIRQITPQTLYTTQHIRQNLDADGSVIDLASPQDSSVIDLTSHRTRPEKKAEKSSPQILQQQTLSAIYSPVPSENIDQPQTVGTAQSFQTTIFMDESASSAAEGGPNFAAMYGVMPQISDQTGTGRVFHDPDALAFQEFLEKTRMIGISDDKAQQLFTPIPHDTVTGFYKGQERIPTLTRTLQYVSETGAQAHYVEADIGNLNGLNARLGHSGADKVFRMITDHFQSGIEETGATSVFFRHGGDEVSAIVINIDCDALTQALDSALKKIDDDISARGLSDLPHLKQGRAPGVRLNYGTSSIYAGGVEGDILSAADTRVELAKILGGQNASGDASTKGHDEPVSGENPVDEALLERVKEFRARAVSDVNGRGTAFEQALRIARSGDLPAFMQPDEYKLNAFVERARQLGIENGVSDLEKISQPVRRDAVTGFYTAEERIPTLERVKEHIAATGQQAHYVEADIGNLGGMNARLGNSGANEVYNEIARYFREEQESLGVDVVLFRHGGDEISSCVIGAEKEQIERALDLAVTRVYSFAGDVSLDQIPHTKKGRKPGISLSYGVSQLTPESSLEEVFSAADMRVELNKTR